MTSAETSYIPSFSAIICSEPVMYKDKIVSDCWQEKSAFQYDKILVSYYYRRINKTDQTRAEISFPDNYTLVGDSGGFQADTQGVDIDIKDLCTWFDSNVDIGFILDVPTRTQYGQSYSHDFFNKALEQTRSNIDEMMKYEMDNKLYGIVQGESTRDRVEWLKMLDDYSFDGLGIAGLNRFDPMEIAKLVLNDFDHDNIHILGAGGAQTTPVITYLGRDKRFKEITFDTSSFSLSGARFASYYAPLYPLPFSGSIQFGRKFGGKLEKIPCSCPLCSLIDDISILCNKENNKVQNNLIQQHNLYQYLQYVKLLDAYKDDEDIFMQFVRNHCSDRTKIAIDFLNAVEDVGEEIAYKRYFKYFSSSEHSIKQQNITDWS